MSNAQQIPIYEDMLTRARREGNKFQEAEALNALGVMYADQGSIQKGIEFLEEALRLRKDVLRDNDKAARTCQNLAGCYELGLGDLATAIRYLEMAQIWQVQTTLRRRRMRRWQRLGVKN